MSEKKKRMITDVLFVLSFAAVLYLSIRKVPFGYQYSDEPFYLTLPRRFMQGDAPLVHEWNLAQLTGVLLYPILRLYLLIKPGFEGIVLNFRYIFVALHSLSSLIIYLALRKDRPLGAAAGALFYMLFAYVNVMALSYNTMALGFATLMTLLMYRGKGKLCRVFTGVLLSMAVLCYPFFASFFVIYFVLTAVNKRGNTMNVRSESEVFSTESFMWTALGVLGSAAVFFVFLLRRCTVSQLFASIPLMLSQSSHGFTAGELFLNFFRGLYFDDRLMGLGFAGLTLLSVLAAADGKRLCRRPIYLLAAALIYAPVGLHIYRRGRSGDINLMPTLICFVGTLCYILNEKRNKRLFHLMYIPGLVLAFSAYIGSDQGHYAFGSGIGPAALSGCIFTAECIEECAEEKGFAKRLCAAALVLVFVCQAGILSLFRKNRCQWETAGPALMCYEIDRGCARGERSVEYNVVRYGKLLEDTEKVRGAEGEYVLYFAFDSWLYLEDGKKNASASAWISAYEPLEAAERLISYWELFPERRPDAIFVSKDFDDAEKILGIVNTEDFPVEENDSGYVLLRMLKTDV